MRTRRALARSSATIAVAVLALVAVGCTPDSGGGTSTTTTTTTIFNPPGNDAPVINSFGAVKASGPSPLTTALQWSVVDADLDPLTCTLDLQSDGTPDITVPGCSSSSVRSATFSVVGPSIVTLSVTDGVAPPVTATTTVNVGAASSDVFNITVRLNGSMTPSQAAAFTTAATRWAQVVRTGLPDMNLNIAANDCGTGAPAFNGAIDDVLIDATISPIDGVGAILGQAGPCYVRSSTSLPFYGAMQFDSADVVALEAGGQFDAVILHEMGHVLGIGTVWSTSVLVGAGGADPRFTGRAAIGAWQAISGVGSIPVENSGGQGTADSHWRESVFDNELMTGYLDPVSNPLSAITVGSLADIGYGVDLAAADPYGLPALRQSTSSPGLRINVIPIVPRST